MPLRDGAEEAPQLARASLSVMRPADAIPVRAWGTQRQSGEHRLDGEAIAWAGRQVRVWYLDPHGREGWA